MKKKPLTWTVGNTLAYDEEFAGEVLALARQNPHTLASLQGSQELQGATYAIIGALPHKFQSKINSQTLLDIASIIILARASGYKEALVDNELIPVAEEPTGEYDIPTSEHRAAEETAEAA